MKLRMKSISLFIAAAVAVGCFAAPISANAASMTTTVGSSVVSVVEDSASHSCVKSTGIESVLEESGATVEDALEAQLGFSESFVEEAEKTEAPKAEAQTAAKEEKAGMEISNAIKGTKTTIVVEKTTIEVPYTEYVLLNKESVSIDKGSKFTLTATVDDKYANKGITWTTSNKAVATVSNGVVTAAGKGTCYVTAKINGTNISSTAKITVNDFILMQVKTTAYCGCKKCNGQWYGQPTASGTDYKVGRTIAVDRHVIKLGSKVEIDGNVYIAEDTGVRGKHIDIYFDSHSSALKYGVKTKIVKVYI